MSNKSVLLSIKPEWADLIYSGQKKIEWRKTKPLDLLPPFKVYLYETFPISKITGYFFCNEILRIPTNEAILFNKINHGCISSDDLLKYIGKKLYINSWGIIEPTIFLDPLKLGDFPPQSWRYFYANLEYKK